ncbi:MAG: RluA family pseudouridine synthase [Clostridia bacterium]|nr:RluA family pseudouridine synthase [Clostridia bacterium]
MQFVVSGKEDGLPLFSVVAGHAQGVPRWAVKAAFKNKEVKVDGKRAEKDFRVTEGQTVRAFFPKEAVLSVQRLDGHAVQYEDERILVVEKPQGIACAGDGDTLEKRAEAMLRTRGFTGSVYPCHRLDVQTGGLVILAKDEESRDAMRSAFEAHEIRKTYTCLVKGCPARREAVLKGYLRKDAALSRVSVTDDSVHGSVPIVTEYRVVRPGETVSMLEVHLVTGRTHQIRAHLAHIGHPILGDDKYGDHALNRALNRTVQCLWATGLRFETQSGRLAGLYGVQLSVPFPFERLLSGPSGNW